ncbi:DUF1934 domain-containing protein [Terribacillus saccharophilus]|uniref:DUF1934 domain-containing protein n=1 Tax=Terribacillus saccharophilus TaxID=361277 RepID=UPI0039828001
MRQIKIPVWIEMDTAITEENDTEYTTLKLAGTYSANGGLTAVSFTEKSEEVGDTKTLITISADKVSIKRTGGFDMKQVFIRNQPTENVYRHPYGTMHMETSTHAMTFSPLAADSPAELKISYTVTLNQVQSRKHALTLRVQEESNG